MQHEPSLVSELPAGAVEMENDICQVRVHVLGDDLALVAPGAQQVAPGEGLLGDRIVRSGRGQQLMDRAHVSSGASAKRILGARTSELNSARRRSAASKSTSRVNADVPASCKASATSGRSSPSRTRPAPPNVSGIAPAFRATTGTPCASASMSGAQKPSCTDIDR